MFIPGVYFLFGVAEVGIKFLGSVWDYHFLCESLCIFFSGPGTSNDTKNLPDVSIVYSSLVNNLISVK